MMNSLFQDKEFYRTMLRIALPIVLQNLAISALNIVDIVMVGQLGDSAIAAVGVANQVYFFMVFLMFGISSGASIFTAQYWGKRDIQNIRKTLGLCNFNGMFLASIFTFIAVVLPEETIGLYSSDPVVIKIGSEYLRIVGISYIVTAISFSYSFVLRSIEQTTLPMVVSIIAIAVNTVLNFILIFGWFGFPALGVYGAALATCIARYLECLVLLGIVYFKATPGVLPVAASIKEMISLTRDYVKKFYKITGPVILNEGIWALGITIYNGIYAHIGTAAVAAVNITSSVDRLAFAIFFGMSSACAVMIGNKIGAGEKEIAYQYAKKFLILSLAGAVFIGLLIVSSAEWILSFYKISMEVHYYAYMMLFFFSAVMWAKTINMVLIVGVFRSGGDTKFCFLLDAGGVWLIGLPLAFLGAFLFHLPVYWVYLLVTAEEFVKIIIGLPRLHSKKWINNLTISE